MNYASFRLVAIAIFAWQSGAAQADCTYVNGAVCGGAAGNGSMSVVNGKVSVAQGGGIYPAVAGKQLGLGARILTASDAAAQADLGAGCFAPIGPSTVTIITSQKGLTCLSQGGARWGGYTAEGPAPEPTPLPYDAGLLALGLTAAGAGAVFCAGSCFNQSVSP